ncbi:hypothetical protein CGCF413_v005198 [Colletotrichum fructicola]|nr:hypothetical protein CGCF413_v005198 [Colletotrichum fructicola]
MPNLLVTPILPATFSPIAFLPFYFPPRFLTSRLPGAAGAKERGEKERERVHTRPSIRVPLDARLSGTCHQREWKAKATVGNIPD